MIKSIFFITALSFLCISCSKNSCQESVKASFKDATGIDGCGMLIELKNGEVLEPSNLSDFQIEANDGDNIWVSYEEVSGASICMMGTIVEISCISERR